MLSILMALLLGFVQGQPAAVPPPAEADFVIRNFQFTSGETLPELRLHYRYALEASRDYDPGPALEKIKAPLFAVNSADDLINPPELQILEKEIARVPKGRAIVIPLSDRTTGHGTHTQAAIWKSFLEELLRSSGTEK